MSRLLGSPSSESVLMYARFPLSLRNVQELLRERGIDISHESAQLGVDRLKKFCSKNISIQIC
jgi:putative transposase